MDFRQLNDDIDDIRLLTILPSKDPSSIVRCELHTVSLTDCTASYRSYLSKLAPTQMPQEILTTWELLHQTPGSVTKSSEIPKAVRFNWGDFAALSYTWGDPTDTRDIIVNGRPTQVTSNLATGLQAFRLSEDSSPGSLRLWLDAICINQSDFVERGLQVQKMGQIYGSAWTVVSWLGDEEDESGIALELLERMASYHGHELEGENLVGLLAKNPEYLGDRVWMPLYDFVERPYWARLWIIQEVVLAARDVLMICGGSKIMWSVLRSGINMIGKHLYTTKNGLLDRERMAMGLEPLHTWDSLNFHHISKSIGGLTVAREEKRWDLSVEKLLEVADRSVATDPRDKIYGLLGLLSSKATQHIVPDYNLEPGVVFTRAAKAFILENLNLEILRECRLWGNFERPSWVPDWTAGFHSREADLPRAYNASSGMVAKFSFSKSGTLLICSGVIFDRIDGLGARQNGYRWDWQCETIIQPTMHKSIHGGYESNRKALYTTLVGDRDLSGQTASTAHEGILSLPFDNEIAFENFKNLGWSEMILEGSYYSRWSNWVRGNRTFWLHDRQFGDYFTEVVPKDANLKLIKEAYARFGHSGLYRRLMTTESGYWGWAPDWQYVSEEALPRKGDVIVILFGCSTPIIMRKIGETYRIVGEAYVQGMMEGESLKMIHEANCEVEEFVIC